MHPICNHLESSNRYPFFPTQSKGCSSFHSFDTESYHSNPQSSPVEYAIPWTRPHSSTPLTFIQFLHKIPFQQGPHFGQGQLLYHARGHVHLLKQHIPLRFVMHPKFQRLGHGGFLQKIQQMRHRRGVSVIFVIQDVDGQLQPLSGYLVG